MTDRDRLILEYPEKMCEYCCNFDKEHIGMDCTALCKLTMTLAYAEDYGGNCMFYNVPKEKIIVPPCKVGDKVYRIAKDGKTITEEQIGAVNLEFTIDNGTGIKGVWWLKDYNIGVTTFLTKEEAERALKEREK